MSITLRPPTGHGTGRGPGRGLGLVAASALLLSGLLSGCGIDSGFHPGVAARVGDDTISVDEVDQAAAAYCTAIEKQLAGSNQVVPQRFLRGGIVGQLTMVAAARQLADEHGVEPGKQYDQKVAELQGAVASLPEDQQRAVIDIESAATYLSSVTEAVGDQLLQARGKKAKPSAATAAGQQALASWFDDHRVVIDPQFGLAIKDGKPVSTDTSISYAVGTTAKNGQAATPDQKYAAGLPDSHRCG